MPIDKVKREVRLLLLCMYGKYYLITYVGNLVGNVGISFYLVANVCNFSLRKHQKRIHNFEQV